MARATPFSAMIEMVETLVSMTEPQWGDYAFSRDPIHRRVPPERRREMAALAGQCGRDEARKLEQRFGTREIGVLAEALGLKITRQASFGVDNFITFAQFREPDGITLFMGNVEAAESLIIEHELSELLQNVSVEQLLVVHEMFHCVEMQNPGIYTNTEKIDLWGIGKFRYQSGMVCLGEIAAMAFAAALLGLNYSPYVFDVLLPWGKDEKQARKLYEDILQFKAPVATTQKEENENG